MENQKSAIEVLTNLRRRPTTNEVLGLLESDILKSSEKIGFSIPKKETKKIFEIQQIFFPLAESMIIQLLKENENNNPTYYPLARDCEIIYDALSGISLTGNNNLETRLHLLKTSLGMGLYVKPAPEYFHQIGITNERVKNGPPVVLIDSGFMGSLFRKSAEWAKIKINLPSKNFKGYLASRCTTSLFDELKFHNGKKIKELKEFEKIMKKSLYKNITKNRDLRHNLCAFMQVMPKFTGRYVQTYCKSDGQWDVMPEQNVYATGLKIKSNKDCVIPRNNHQKDISSIPSHVNDNIINPVMALLLQKRTLEYFTDPNVQDRIYDQIKKH